jgi:methylmalonyl-CoA mutase cobalamin-binding subunit
MTATIDDGWGHGLSLIHQYAEVIGLRIKHLGLLQSSEKIIVECNTDLPDFLGLTVLQFDTEDELIHLTRHLPSTTVVIAGGPVFSKDPEFAERSGIHYVAKNAAHFLTFMLAFTNFS